MVSILRRLFVKDYQNTANPKVRSAHGILAAVFGMITNAILVALKLTAAFLLASSSGGILSMALLGDALNNLSDFAASTVTLVGFALAKKPADKEHPYGHQRIEYVAGLVVALLILFAAFELLAQSISKIAANTPTSYDVFALVILGVAILIKGLQSYVNFGLAKAIDSSALKATGVDSLTDAIATSIILISALLTYFLDWGFLDGYMGVLVAVFVGIAGVKMILEESNPLIGSPYSKELQKEIKDIALSHKEILSIHDVLCHSYGPTARYVSFHAEVNEELPLKEAHELIDSIEEEISSRLSCVVTIHIDPVAMNDPRIQEYPAKIEELIKPICDEATIHDLRLKTKGKKETLCFDIEIPFHKGKGLEKSIKEQLKNLGIETEVQIDHPFTE